jgi:hypothetical protein
MSGKLNNKAQAYGDCDDDDDGIDCWRPAYYRHRKNCKFGRSDGRGEPDGGAYDNDEEEDEFDHDEDDGLYDNDLDDGDCGRITQEDLSRLRAIRHQQRRLADEGSSLRQKLFDLHEAGATHEAGPLRLRIKTRQRRQITKELISEFLGRVGARRLLRLIPPKAVKNVIVESSATREPPPHRPKRGRWIHKFPPRRRRSLDT